MINKKMHISSVFIAAALGFSGAAFAYDRQEMQRAAEQFDLISPAEAAEIATDTKQGYVSDLELEARDHGQGYIYEAEVNMEDGSEWDFDIDAKTGEILHMERDD